MGGRSKRSLVVCRSFQPAAPNPTAVSPQPTRSSGWFPVIADTRWIGWLMVSATANVQFTARDRHRAMPRMTVPMRCPKTKTLPRTTDCGVA